MRSAVAAEGLEMATPAPFMSPCITKEEMLQLCRTMFNSVELQLSRAMAERIRSIDAGESASRSRQASPPHASLVAITLAAAPPRQAVPRSGSVSLASRGHPAPAAAIASDHHSLCQPAKPVPDLPPPAALAAQPRGQGGSWRRKAMKEMRTQTQTPPRAVLALRAPLPCIAAVSHPCLPADGGSPSIARENT